MRWTRTALLITAATFASAGAEPQSPQLPPRILAAESGTKGSEQGGRFVIEDPRTAFHYPEDQQIIVSFEWIGRRGQHHFEGRWRNPSGKVVMLSEFAYESPGERFGAYWTFQLNVSVMSGLWALEAVVDGQVAGMHAFQILAELDRDLTQSGRAQQTPAQLYGRALSTTVSVYRIDAQGQRGETGSGFLLPGGKLLTTFGIVDGASRLRVAFPDETVTELAEILAWDRRADWALFAHGRESESLTPAEAGSIGDRCVSLDIPMEGSRVLAEGQIVGRQSFPEVGERLSASFSLAPEAYGSPVLNDYGEVVGLAVSPGTWPGLSTLSALRLTYPRNLPPRRAAVTTFAPLSAVRVDAPGPPVPLSKLAATGQFLQPLVENEHIGEAVLARGVVETKNRPPQPEGDRMGEFEFARNPGRVFVFVTWNPLDKIKAGYHLEVYDLENQRIFQGAGNSLELEAYTRSHTWWTLDVSRLPTAIYRVDLMMNGRAVWRTFFKVTE